MARHRRARRKRITVWLVVGVLVVVAVGIASAGLGGSKPKDQSVTGLPPATATVTRATLTQTEQLNGTLGYGDTATLVARSGSGGGSDAAGSGAAGGGAAGGGGSGGGGGTITWLPAEGAKVTRGHPAWRVDNLPVPLIYGTLPLYRQLTSGISGPDVKELEQNLKALGYTG